MFAFLGAFTNHLQTEGEKNTSFVYTDKSALQIHVCTVLAAVFHCKCRCDLDLDLMCTSCKCAQSLPSFHFVASHVTASEVTVPPSFWASPFASCGRKSLYHHLNAKDSRLWCVCKPWSSLQVSLNSEPVIFSLEGVGLPTFKATLLVVCDPSPWSLLEDLCGISGFNT